MSAAAAIPRVGDLDAHPYLIKVFKDDVKPADASQYRKMTKEEFLNVYAPEAYVSAGSSGMVFRTPILHPKEGERNPVYLYIRPDGTFVIGNDPEILGLRLFDVALKIVPLGIKGRLDPDFVRPIRNEVAINKYLESITVGRGSDLFAHSPYVKMFTDFDLELTMPEVRRIFDSYEDDWTKTPFRKHPELFTNMAPDSVVAVINVQVFEYVEGGTLHDFFELNEMFFINNSLNRALHSDQLAQCLMPMLLHCLCTLYLFHTIIRGTHYDSRPSNWLLRTVPLDTVVRYPVATNLTLFIPASATLGLVPVLADFGAALIDVQSLQPNDPRGSRDPNLDGRDYRLRVARSRFPLDDYQFFTRHNPDFDVQLFSREIFRIIDLDMLIKAGFPAIQLLTDMIGPLKIPEANQVINDRDLDRYHRFRQRMEVIATDTSSTEDQLHYNLEDIGDVIWPFLWLPIVLPGSTEPQLFQKFFSHFERWSKPDSVITPKSVVVDFDVRIGHLAGGTLPRLNLSMSPISREEQQEEELAARRERREAADEERREQESAPITGKQKGKRALGFPGDQATFDEDAYLDGDDGFDEVESICCWNCETDLAEISWQCAHCQEAIYCSENCMVSDQEAHHRHERCHGGLTIDAGGVDDSDKNELLQEAKAGEAELKRRNVKPIKTSRFRRALRFLVRQGVRLGETIGSAIGGVFGADTLVDLGVFAGIEFPMFIAPIVSAVKAGGDLAKFLKFFITVRMDGTRSIGPFQGGVAGVEDTVQPMIDSILAKNPAMLKLLQRMCVFFDSMADKIAGSLASALEVIAVEFFGIARFTSYQALYGAFTKGSKKMAGVVRRLYEKIPMKARAWFENFDMTVELITKLKERFMKVIDWMVRKAPGKLSAGVARLQKILEKIPPRKLALALHSVLGLGYVALLVRARCQ